MESNYFVFTTEHSSAFKSFLYVFMILLLYFFQYNLILCSLLLFITIFFLFTQEGIILDLDNKRYKRARLWKQKSLLPWRNLPNIEYISVFKASMVSRAYSMGGVCVQLQKKVIVINLIYDKKQKLQVFQTLDCQEALEKALFISNKIQVPVYDATNQYGKWL